ncbi:MAG: hypothetical protein WC822_04480 [Candidatus Paceibacterota bacterium]
MPFGFIIDYLIETRGEDGIYEKAMSFNPLWDIDNGRTLCKECHKKTPTYQVGARYIDERTKRMWRESLDSYILTRDQHP